MKLGFPIRASPVQRLPAPRRGLSQLGTPFISARAEPSPGWHISSLIVPLISVSVWSAKRIRGLILIISPSLWSSSPQVHPMDLLGFGPRASASQRRRSTC